MNLLRNDVNNLLINTDVRIKIYREFITVLFIYREPMQDIMLEFLLFILLFSYGLNCYSSIMLFSKFYLKF